MTIESPWRPRTGEKTVLKGTGRRGDFHSVQSVLEATEDHVLLTGGWIFEKRDGAWRTPSSSEILLHSAPQLNPDDAHGTETAA
jgi:hypothetical protein